MILSFFFQKNRLGIGIGWFLIKVSKRTSGKGGMCSTQAIQAMYICIVSGEAAYGDCLVLKQPKPHQLPVPNMARA